MDVKTINSNVHLKKGKWIFLNNFSTDGYRELRFSPLKRREDHASNHIQKDFSNYVFKKFTFSYTLNKAIILLKKWGW